MRNLMKITTMWSLIIIFGLLIGACGGGGTEQLARNQGDVAITVTDSGGTSLSGVQVNVRTTAVTGTFTNIGTTDTAGKLTFTGDADKDYFFTFSKSGFTTQTDIKRTPQLTSTVALNVTLISGSAALTVSGVAASGAPMTGQAFLKDSAINPAEMSTPINAQGVFSFDVTGKTGPFMLRSGSLYSMSGPGTVNINPLSHLMVADMGAFGDMSSLNTFYNNPDPTKMRTMFANTSTARLHLRQTLAPLLSTYGVSNADPISGAFPLGQGMDKMFDDVKMTIAANGQVSMMYISGTPVFSGPMGNMAGGTMMSGNIVTPGATPASGITINPSEAKLLINGTQQFTANIPVTWTVVNTNSGSITSGGLYTAPAFQGVFLVKATSVADTTKSTTATIHVGSMGMMM